VLNALLPGTVVPIHRHPMSNENVICLCGKLVEVLFDVRSTLRQAQDRRSSGTELVETERIHLDPSLGNFGCVVPAGVWHTVEVLEPSVIYEAKDGAYGQDGSESWNDVKKGSECSECLEDFKSLKEQITYLIGMERQSGSMDNPSPLYISRMLNVPLEEVEKAMDSM